MADTQTSNDDLDKILKSFESCNPKLNDVRLIVQGRMLYASAKILAQYSTEFFRIFSSPLNCPSNDLTIRDIVINDSYYEHFRSFLALLHNHTNVIKKHNFLALGDLSFKYKADQCLEECEKFVMKQNFDAYWSLKYAEKFNWKRLKEQVLHSYYTVYDLLNFCGTTNLEHLSPQTNNDILNRMVELKHNKPIADIVISQTGVTNQTIGEIPWTVIFTNDHNCFQALVSCNVFDNSNPWKCRFSIECVKKDTNEVIKKEHHVLCPDSRSIVFKCGAGPEPCSLPSRSDIQIHLQIYSVTGIFPQRSTSFSEERLNLTDVTLSIGDKKFHVSKQILAYHSKYFYLVFYANSEKDRKRVALKNVDQAEFENCLQAIYHPSRLITDTNINGLLRISHMYGIRVVFQKCENFFQMDDNMNDAKKLKLTEKYNFPLLHKQITSGIKTWDDFKKLSLLDGFDELKTNTLGYIAKKLLRN